MKIEDRLKKAERKLHEHMDVCKQCDWNIKDVSTPQCQIALQLARAVDKIKKQIKRSK